MSRAVQDAVAGSLGALTSSLCTYPLDVAKTRLQAQRRTLHKDGSNQLQKLNALREDESSVTPQHYGEQPQQLVSDAINYLGPIDCLCRIVREEGPLQLLMGLRPTCVKAALTNFIYFYLLRAVAPVLRRAPLLQGTTAGVGVQLIVLPIDMIVTRQQSSRGNNGWLSVLGSIVKQQGILGLWSGLGPGLFLTLNPGINQMILSWLKRGRETVDQSAVRAFWSGALAKAVAGFITYPYMRVKVQMQVQGMTSSGSAPSTSKQVLSLMVREGGVLSLFDGLVPQLTNGVLKEAILNMVRLKIAVFVARVFTLLK